MIPAVLLGIVAGLVGFMPLLVGLRMTKKVTSTSNFGHMGILIVSLVISFVLMFAFALACNAAAHDVALPFVLAEAVALSVAAIVLGIKRLGKDKKEG